MASSPTLRRLLGMQIGMLASRQRIRSERRVVTVVTDGFDKGFRRQFGTTAGVYNKGGKGIYSYLEDHGILDVDSKLYGSYKKVKPEKVSKRMPVPSSVKLPDYWFRYDGKPPKPAPKKPHIKTDEELNLMRNSCLLAREVLDETLKRAQPGMTTDDLDKFAHNLIISKGAFPSALTYRQFPKSICTSVNNIACHGIPDDRKLVSGDIVTVDLMVYKDGFHGDCARTALVGNVDEKGKKLVQIAEECLDVGMMKCGPGVSFEVIGRAIENHANNNGMTVIHVFTGHGVGKNIHEQPDIYHYDRAVEQGGVMQPGMTFTIEPVITQGMDLIMILGDGWTAATIDGARAAQFENTILITETGYEVLTKPKE